MMFSHVPPNSLLLCHHAFSPKFTNMEAEGNQIEISTGPARPLFNETYRLLLNNSMRLDPEIKYVCSEAVFREASQLPKKTC